MGAVLDTIFHLVLLGHLITSECDHTFGLRSSVSWELGIELRHSLTSQGVVESVQQVSHHTEGLGDNTTDLTRVIATFTSSDSDVAESDTTEGACQPELIVIECTGVKAEEVVGASDVLLRNVEQVDQVR